MMTESEIIKKCQEYDKTAFKELVRVYSNSLMSVCLRYMGQRHLAEDMLQESYIRIFNNILQYKEVGSFKSWMCRIAATTCLKELRKNIVLVDIDIASIENQFRIEPLELMDEHGIYKIVEELPMPYRLVFNLYVIEGYSHQEISEMIGVAESTSRTQLVRARMMIKSLLKKNNVERIA
jgi:RNA polymerase sigma factor (sigma-70 family)